MTVMSIASPGMSCLLLLALAASLPAQVPDYNGVWSTSPPLQRNPLLLFPANHMRIVAQPPSISCSFGFDTGTAIAWSGAPLEGQLTGPTSATLSLQTQPSQCVWIYALNITFTAADRITGTLLATDLYSCFYQGTVTQPFTAQRTVLPMYERFADGCPGSTTLAITAAAPPSLAAGFGVTIASLPVGVAFLATGFSNTTAGTTALPFDLTQLGMPGCRLNVALDHVEAVAGGTAATVSWTLPNAPSLLGTTFYQQAFVPDPGLNTLGARMSEAMVGVVGA